MPARRAPAEFSLSFLDVICCGFGAVILLLMITKAVQPQVIEQVMVDAESAMAELTEQLFEIRGETTMLNRDLNVNREQISEYEEKIAILQGTLARTRSAPRRSRPAPPAPARAQRRCWAGAGAGQCWC